MELDGYCQPLKIAFEHQGEQHYTTKSHLIRSKHDLSKIKLHDKLKRKLCKERDVVLIQIPEIPNRLPIDEVKAFIKKQCELKGFPYPADFDSIKVNLKSAYTNPSSREILDALKVIADEKGGKCLSKVYKGDNKKLLWECSKGHQWKAVPSSIKQGKWCPYCAGIAKKTIEQMHQLAKERGGRCLSEKYINNQTKLLWECSEGHRWKATPRQGKWCPYCAGRGKTIEDMQKLAKGRGGKCISKAFLGARKKLLWECSKGHQWMAIPDSIRRGSWCPQCRGSKKQTIEKMRQIAKKRGGKCLSNIYLNNSSKLLWECENGHQWEAIYSSIQRGRWCPVCRSNKHTIEQMKKLAKEHDGKCLSSRYVNLRTELLWECRRGHRWKDQPRRIKDGGWCRECRRKNRKTNIGLT
jgi:thiol-disulfide isomerase/thioredoxin